MIINLMITNDYLHISTTDIFILDMPSCTSFGYTHLSFG
jgi:hypothetical protein